MQVICGGELKVLEEDAGQGGDHAWAAVAGRKEKEGWRLEPEGNGDVTVLWKASL